MNASGRSRSLLPGQAGRLNLICDRFEEQWLAGVPPRLEEFLPLVEEADRPALLRELLDLELHYRGRRGERVTEEEYKRRLPQYSEPIADFFSSCQRTGDESLQPNLSEHASLPTVRGTLDAPDETIAATPSIPNIPGYEILGELGRGGMGVVYKARQTALGRVVALKMILHADHAGTYSRARFKAEAEAVARLQHPNIVQIFEVGEASGLPYFSLEFCPGGSLDRKLGGTPLPAAEAARLVESLARAVEVAHRAQVVHRDLKPANVLMGADGQPKITDFGLAKKLDVQGQTQTGAVMGTPSYMAPEQAGGRNVEVGPAADVYALGAILYELLTGRPPFKAANAMETLLQVLHDEPVPVRSLQPSVPRDLETICLKCLEKVPAHRYGSAAGLADDLRRFLAGESVQARPAGAFERLSKWVRRRPVDAAASALLGLALLLAGGGSTAVWLWRQAAVARATAEDAQATATQAGQELAKTLGDLEKAQEELAHIAYADRISLAQREWEAGRVGPARQSLGQCAERFHDTWEWQHCQLVMNPESAVLRGHEGEVTAVYFSPDGSWLASKDDRSVRLWDASAGSELAVIHWPQGGLKVLAVNQDGKTLASTGENDGTVRLWDVAGKERAALRGHRKPVTALAFSPDANTLASGSEDGTVRLWDVAGKVRAVLRGHSAPVVALAYSPDGKTLASASHDATVRLWDAAGKARAVLRGHGSGVTHLAYSPDGETLASAGQDGTMRLWDADGRAGTIIRAHKFGVQLMAYSPDGKTLASASIDGEGGSSLHLWDTSGRELATLRGHELQVLAIAFSPDGSRLASSSADKTVRLWDTASGKVLAVLRGHVGGDLPRVWALAFSPDGSRLASASGDGTVRLWDGWNKGVVTFGGHEGLEQLLAFSADGKKLATVGSTTLRVWNTTGKELAVLRGQHNGFHASAFSPDGKTVATSEDQNVRLWDASGRYLTILRGHEGLVTRLVFSPDNSRLASASEDTTVRLWDLSGKERALLRGHDKWGAALAFSPDGKVLATGGGTSVRLLDAASGKELVALHDPAGVQMLAFSPDGKTLASVARATVRLWDVTGRELGILRGHQSELPVQALAFSPDGQILVTGSHDGTVSLWEIASGKEMAVLRGHEFPIRSLAFSPDGSRLASASEDGTVRVWDAAGREVAVLRGDGEIVQGVAFSPDGKTLASTDNVVRLWLTQEHPEDHGNRRWVWHEQQAAAAERHRRWFSAEFHLRELLRHDPDNAKLRRRRGRVHAERNRWREAIDDFDRADALQSPGVGDLHCYAWALLASGDAAGYRRACKQLCEHFKDSADADARSVVAYDCSLIADVDAARLLPLAESAVRKEPNNWSWRENLGIALYRAGRYRDAVDQLSQAARQRSGGASVDTNLFLAMAHHRLGEASAARQSLARVATVQDKRQAPSRAAGALGTYSPLTTITWLALPAADMPDPGGGNWEERLVLRLLRAEAESVVHGDEARHR